MFCGVFFVAISRFQTQEKLALFVLSDDVSKMILRDKWFFLKIQFCFLILKRSILLFDIRLFFAFRRQIVRFWLTVCKSFPIVLDKRQRGGGTLVWHICAFDDYSILFDE